MRASFCSDVATHTDYRKQGVFTQLGFHSLEKERESNVAFTVGFPWVGGIVIPGHLKVDWMELGELSIYTKTDLSDYRLQANNGIMIRRISQFDERFDTLVDTHKEDLPIMLRRNVAYLNWRYFQKVGYTYYCFEIQDKGILVGFFVLKSYEAEREDSKHN